jgi:hypothetical protein
VEQRKKPQPTPCECEALVSLGHAYLGSSVLDPGDVKCQVCGPFGASEKGQGTKDLSTGLGATGKIEPQDNGTYCATYA